MKIFRVFATIAFIIGVSQVSAQEKNKEKENKVGVSKQDILDKPVKCQNIKEGTFQRINYPRNLWYLTVKDNVQTEYYNDGKDYIKSTMVFVDDCNYKAIVVEKTEEDNPIKVGDVYSNRIFATLGNFLRIESILNGEKYDLPLEKMVENKK